jgi:hypothetical protein
VAPAARRAEVVQLSDGRSIESRPVNLLFFKPRLASIGMDGNPRQDGPYQVNDGSGVDEGE